MEIPLRLVWVRKYSLDKLKPSTAKTRNQGKTPPFMYKKVTKLMAWEKYDCQEEGACLTRFSNMIRRSLVGPNNGLKSLH